MVPPVRLERTLPCGNQILSLTRLPIPPQGHCTDVPASRGSRAAQYAVPRQRWQLPDVRSATWPNDHRLSALGRAGIRASVVGSGGICRGLQMLRRLYDRTIEASRHPHAERWLFGVSFIESSVFPIPPDVMLIPMILADRAKAWRYAFTCTLASVLGGVFGYLIGAMFFDFVGRPMLELYGNAEKFGVFQAHFEEWGAWAVFFAGITPFPYKVITVASGFIQLNLMIFVIASVLARGMRFFAVAGLLWYFGEPIRALLEKHLGKIPLAVFLALFGGFLALKWLF